MRRLTAKVLALLLALGMIAAACGDSTSSSSSGASGSTGTSGASGRDVTPVSGGSLTMAMYSETRALDPVDSSGSGTAGGTELAALYDTIMRWNPATGQFEPRTAESLVANADLTQWTLKLKPNITFRDGTPYDATAVKLSIDRHKSPQNVINASRAHLEPVQSVTIVDPLTVAFQLSEPWAGFPYVLADEPGMLVSPTAIKALGDPSDPGYKDRKAAFNLNPVGAGAGPFEIESFKPKDSIVMKKNPNYWGGPVYLDELRFVTGGGGSTAWESVKTGTVQAAFLRSPIPIADAKTAKFPGYESIVQAGGLLLLNNGVEVTCAAQQPAPACTGKADGTKAPSKTATSNVKVRQAVAAAVDPGVINQRVDNGKGLPGNALFQPSFPFSPGVGGPTVDPEQAKKLLGEAKAEGYDGKIRILCTNTPERQALATAVETMLKAVGFDVTTRSDLDVQGQIGEINTKKDFDIACWGFAISGDEGAVLALLQNLSSQVNSNRIGYKNPAFDAALKEGLAANTPEQKKAAYKKLADIWNTDVPSLAFEAVSEYVVWQPKVHGIYADHATIVYFDKAFIAK